MELMSKQEYLLGVAEECKEELRALNIEFAENVYFEINTRAKSRFGRCRKVCSWNNEFTIEITDMLLEKNVPTKSLKNTIIHELLHTVDGCMNHKSKWKNLANKVNNAYGYDIKRASSFEERGVKMEIAPKKINYMFKCKGCGQTIKRTRKSKFTEFYNYYTCGCCGVKFEKIL